MEKQIKELFEDLKSDIIHKLSNPIDEQDKEFQNKFNEFIQHISKNYFEIFSHGSSEEKLFLSKNKNIEPYWKLIKTIREHEANIYKAVTENKDETIQNVANVLKSKDTLDFINMDSRLPLLTNLSGEKELINDTNASLKMERFSHYFAYTLAGNASQALVKIKKEQPEIQEEDLFNYLRKDFNNNASQLKLTKNLVEIFPLTSERKTTAGRNTTDGVAFEELSDGSIRCYIVFSTARHSTTGQGKQLFRQTEYLESGIQRQDNTTVAKIKEITPVLTCLPIATNDQGKNPFKEIFEKHHYLNKDEVDLLNSIPLFTELANIDNTNTPVSINKLINTIYFTMGENTLNTHNQLQLLKQIDSPEREKEFLKIVARKVNSISQFMGDKSEKEPKKILNKDKELSGLTQDLCSGLAFTINGLVQHSAYYKEDSKFLEEIQEILQDTSTNFTKFIQKIHPSNAGNHHQHWLNLTQAIRTIRPSSIITNIQETIVYKPIEKGASLDLDKINEAAQRYIEKHIKPLGNQSKWGDHFLNIIQTKLTYEKIKNTPPGTTTAIDKYIKSESTRYNNDFPELNKQVQTLYFAIDNNSTTENILSAIERASLSQGITQDTNKNKNKP